jgi:CRP-like cAMP-binding protein
MNNMAAQATRKTVPAAAVSGSAGQATAREKRAVDPLDRLGFGVEFAKGRTLYCEGDDARHFFKVVSGVVRLCKVTEDGRRQIAAFLTAGDFLGWTNQDDHAYSAEAVTRVTLLKYSRRQVEEIVRTDPAAARRVLVLLSDQLALAHDHLLLLGRMTAAERISAFLLHLNKRPGAPQIETTTIELPMTRRDIADYLGLTIETVSRTLSAMKRKGLLTFTDAERVRLKRYDVLERMATAA